MTSDDRFTWGLVIDVFDVLERHGYHQYDKQHTGQAFGLIFNLAYVYDGTRDAHYSTYPNHASPGPHAGPESSERGTDDAVILTGTDVGTVAAALDVAADYRLDRAAACADCADKSCLACQSRLQDAQAYDQIAARMPQSSEDVRTTNSGQPVPGSQPASPRQAHPTADREAGQ
jgi:hypothetical protein